MTAATRITVAWVHIQVHTGATAVMEVIPIRPTIGRDRVVGIDCRVAGKRMYTTMWLRPGAVDLQIIATWIEGFEDKLRHFVLGRDRLAHLVKGAML